MKGFFNHLTFSFDFSVNIVYNVNIKRKGVFCMKNNTVVSARLTENEEKNFLEVKDFINERLKSAGFHNTLYTNSDVVKYLIAYFHLDKIEEPRNLAEKEGEV